MQKVKLNKIAEAIYMDIANGPWQTIRGNLTYSGLPHYMKLEYLERARQFVRVARALIQKNTPKKKCSKGFKPMLKAKAAFDCAVNDNNRRITQLGKGSKN